MEAGSVPDSPPNSPLSSVPSSLADEFEFEFLPDSTSVLGKHAIEQLEDGDDIENQPKRVHLDESVSDGITSNTGTDQSLPPASSFASSSSHEETNRGTGCKQASRCASEDSTDEGSQPDGQITKHDLLTMEAQHYPALDRESRPAPSAQPEVYSRYRTAICEALPYFSAFQGSLYTIDLEARGFLIDKEIEKRDYLGSQVIVTTW